jgi:hypothetical protein
MADASAVSAKCKEDGTEHQDNKVGVGAAVAVNVLGIVNKAYIETSSDIKAKSITVKATGDKKKEEKKDDKKSDKKDDKKDDKKEEPKEVDVPNTVRVYAVSGAGASNVGVAGSVAISRTSGDIDAHIKCVKDGVLKSITTTEGNVEVLSAIPHDEQIIASASLVKKDKKPDKNEKEGEKKAQEDAKEAKDGTQAAKTIDKEGTNKGKEDKSSEENEKPDKDDKNNPKNPSDKGKSASEATATAVGVGASFTLNISSLTTKAYIEAAKVTSSKDVKIEAKENIERKLYSVAGTDPFTKGATANKGVDASVSINISNDEVTAFAEKNIEIAADGAFKEASSHKANTRVKASGFAVGNQAAIGASIALNISNATVESRFIGNAAAEDGISITSKTEDVDYSTSLASAMGTTNDKSKEDSDKQPGDDNKDNKTATDINKALNDNKSEKSEGEASNSKAVSTNLLKTQDVKTESTEKNSKVGSEIAEAETAANAEAAPAISDGKSGTDKVEDGAQGTPETKIAVAATIGINITKHIVRTLINANLDGKGDDVELTAENSAQYSALGTGLTMTQFPGTATVAAGVAVAINNNEALVVIGDRSKIKSVTGDGDDVERGDIEISAKMSNNTENAYMASQAVSGSIARKSSKGDNAGKVNVSGAVAILITKAKANTTVGPEVVIDGAAITISAEDDYKHHIRAGSLGYATDTNVGVGASFAMLYANDNIDVKVGDGVSITGESLKVTATRKNDDVTKQLSGLLKYITMGMTVYSAYTDDKVVSTKDDKKGNKEVSLKEPDLKSMETIGAAFTAINVFIKDSYHIESFSGSYVGGSGKLNAGGAVSLGFLNSTVSSQVGQRVNINIVKAKQKPSTTGDKKEEGKKEGDKKEEEKKETDVVISATDDSLTGVYSIGVLASSAKVSAGGSIAVIINNSTVDAKLGSGAKINVADGGFKLYASSKDSNLLATTSASVTTKGNGFGGNINVYVNKVKTTADAQPNADINASKDITIAAESGGDNLLIVGGVQGGKETVAGGTISVAVFSGETQAKVADSKLTTEKGNVVIKAHSDESALSILASASASVSSKPSVAGIIDIKVANSVIRAVAKALNITAKSGDVSIVADTKSKLTTIDASLALSLGSVAAGGLVAVNVVKRTITAVIDGVNTISAAGNVLINAFADGGSVKVLASGQVGGNSFGGVISVDVENNTITAGNLEGDKSTVSAKGSIGISAVADLVSTLIIGQVNGALTTGVGGVISTVVINNTITAGQFGDFGSEGSKILEMPSLSQGTGPDRKRKIRGIAVDASERQKINTVTIAGGGAASVAVSGVITTLVAGSRIKSQSREGSTLKAVRADGASDDGSVPLAIEVVAYDSAKIIDAAGTLNGSASAAVGATVAVLTYNATVDAQMNAASVNLDTKGKEGGIRVQAYKDDNLFIVAAGLAGSGSAAVGATPVVAVYKNNVSAKLNSPSVVSVTKNTTQSNGEPARESVLVSSNAISDVSVLAAVATGSGSVAVSPAISVIYFYNSSTADIVNSKIDCGSLVVESNTREKINNFDAALSGSGSVAVGAGVAVVITDVNSKAFTEGTTINAHKDNGSYTSRVRIRAKDEFELLSVEGAVGASGAVGVGASVLVAVTHNKINAYVGNGTEINTQDAFELVADSDRYISGYSLSVGAGGGAVGVGAAVAVVVAGTGLDIDTAEAITKANLNPGNSVRDAFAKSDSRAAKSSDSGSLVNDLNNSLSPQRQSANSVATSAVPGGDYGNLGKNFNEDTGEQISSSLKGKISDDSDKVSATVMTANITAASVKVSARENVNSLLITGAVSGGMDAGVGAGITVALITSNVLATVSETANITSTASDIAVISELSHGKRSEWSLGELIFSHGGKSFAANDIYNKAAQAEKDSNGKSHSLATDYGMMLISGAGGGGLAGVGVNVAYYNNSAVVKSIVSGTLNSATDKANNIIVKASVADTNPGASPDASGKVTRVGTFIVGVGAGLVGTGVNVALATNNAEVTAGFESQTPKTSHLKSGSLHVLAETKVDLISVNGVVAVGAVGAGVIVAITNNKVEQQAFIGKNYSFDYDESGNGNKNNRIEGIVESELESYFAGLAVGAVGAGVTVVIANNNAQNRVIVEQQSDTGIRLDNLTLIGSIKGDTKVIGAVVAAGAIGADAAVALALQNAKNNVNIHDTSLCIKNGLQVIAQMKGQANCNVVSLNAGAIGAGATVALSMIKADNIAEINQSGGRVIEAGAVVVHAGGQDGVPYDSTAVTTIVTAGAGAIGAAINYGYASNKATNHAVFSTAGDVKAGSVTVNADAKSKSLAVAVGGALGAIAGNVSYVKAILKAIDKAEFKVSKSPKLQIGSLGVFATHNDADTRPDTVTINTRIPAIGEKTIEPQAAADARIFAGSIGAGAVSANYATATNDSTVLATIDLGNENVTGEIGGADKDINAMVRAASTAYARAAAANISLADFGAVNTNAEALGTFKATFTGPKGAIKTNANNLNVTVDFTANADAMTEPCVQGIKVTTISSNGNSAIAKVSITAEASLKASPSNVSGDINVKSTGSVTSHARIVGTKINVSGARIGADVVEATAVVNNNAYFNSGIEDKVNANNINIWAVLEKVDVQARGGASSSGVKVELLGGGIATVSSSSDITNLATVENSQIVAKGTISIRSDVAKLDAQTGLSNANAVKVEAVADAPDYSIGVVSAQAVKTSVDSESTVRTHIRGITFMEASQIDIISADNTVVTSTGSAPQVSVTVVGGESVSVVSQTAKKRTRLVETIIEGNVYLTTTGLHSAEELERIRSTRPLADNVTIKALSNLDVYAKLGSMQNYSGIKLGAYKLATDIGDVTANIRFNGVIETQGDAVIHAENRILSHNDDLKAINAGLIGAGTSIVSGSINAQNATIELSSLANSAPSSITASLGNVNISAITYSQMHSVIESSDYGLGTKSGIEAVNSLSRNTQVTVANVEILGAGNVGIYADAKLADIQSKATGQAGGAAQKALPTSTINYTEKTTVRLDGKNKITAQLGAADVVAQSASDLQSFAEYTMTGGIESNNPKAVINSKVDLMVVIGKDSESPTSILGADVFIAAHVDKQNHVATSRALTRSFATFTEAKSEITSNNNILVDIGNAIISGYETLGIYALAKDLHEDAISFASIKGVTGKVYSHSKIEGGTIGTIYVGNDKYKATLAGPDVVIMNGFDKNFSVDNNIKRDATADGQTITNWVTQKIQKVETVVDKVTTWMPWPFKNIIRWVTRKVVKVVTETVKVVTYSDAVAYKEGSYKVAGDVKVNIDLYSGEFAAGITILIDKDKRVVATGIPRQDISKYIKVENHQVTIADIKETKQGKFTINAFDQAASGTVRLINSAYISSLTIDNYSGLPLYIRDIYMVETVERTKAELEQNPPIALSMPEGVKLTFGPASYCNVVINTHGSKLVFRRGVRKGNNEFLDFDAGQGSIVINCDGGGVYTEPSAFIAANKVVINGAREVNNVWPSGNGFNIRLFEIVAVDNDRIKAEGRSGVFNMVLARKGEAVVFITPVRMYYENVKESSDMAHFRFENLDGDWIVLRLNAQMYTTMVKPDNIIGRRRNRYAIRDYTDSRVPFNATFWFENVTADTFKVWSYPNRRRANYTLMINQDNYNVKEEEFKGRYTIIRYPNQDGGGGGSAPYQDNGPHTYVDIYNKLLQRDKTMKRDNINPIPSRESLAKGTYNKFKDKSGKIQARKLSLKDTVLKNYRIWSDMDNYGALGAFFDNVANDFDVLLVVDKDEWSYLVMATFPGVAGIMRSLGIVQEGNETIENALTNSLKAHSTDESYDSAITRLVTGANYLYGLVPVTLLLLAFLFFTRKKEDEG